jgi:hypothetical protein
VQLALAFQGGEARELPRRGFEVQLVRCSHAGPSTALKV